jgi:hypothetical protein
MHLALTIVLGVVAMGLAFALILMWGQWPLDDSKEIAERIRERDVEHARAEALAQELSELRAERKEHSARIEEALGDVSKGLEALRRRAEESAGAANRHEPARASQPSEEGAERERASAQETERLGVELSALRELHAAVTQQLSEVEQRERDLRAANDQQQQDVFDLAERLYRAECALAEKNGQTEGETDAGDAEQAGHAEDGEGTPGSSDEEAPTPNRADEDSVLGDAADAEGAQEFAPERPDESATREDVLAALGALEANLPRGHDAPSRTSYPRGSLTMMLDDADELTVVSDDRAPSAVVDDRAHDVPVDTEAEAGEHSLHLPRSQEPDNDAGEAEDEHASQRRPLSIPDDILKAPAR